MSTLPDELADLPAPLRALLEAELAAGNRIAAIEHGFPAPPVGCCVHLTQTISTQIDADLRHREWPNWNGSSGYTDTQAHFFLINPAPPPPPEPVMQYAADGSWIGNTIAAPPNTTSGALSRFCDSMQIDYEKWHDGIGYDLEALRSLEGLERQTAEALLLARNTQDWRDVEALAALDSPSAQQALREAAHSANAEIALAVARHAPHLIPDTQRTANIVAALEQAEFYQGLSQAIDQAADHHPPEVLDALWRGVLEREGGIAVHFAALLTYLHGQANASFDMEQRPYFLRFHTEDRAQRAALVEELRQRLQSLQE